MYLSDDSTNESALDTTTTTIIIEWHHRRRCRQRQKKQQPYDAKKNVWHDDQMKGARHAGGTQDNASVFFLIDSETISLSSYIF